MKVGIFYFSLVNKGPGYWPVYEQRFGKATAEQIFNVPPVGFVRVELVEASSEEAALSMATPAETETLLNTCMVFDGN